MSDRGAEMERFRAEAEQSHYIANELRQHVRYLPEFDRNGPTIKTAADSAADTIDYMYAEILRLRAEVERLHLTGSERISLGWGADLLDQRGNWQSAATLRGLLARLGGGQ